MKMENNRCEYHSECPVLERTLRDCNDSQNCQTKRFYNMYGLDYLSLGVGACCDPELFDRVMQL